MLKFKSRGFTLIELLVVIAIIGILSAVVLASLSTARQKGNNAAVQSNLASIQTQAEIDYGNNNNSYGSITTVGTCTSGGTGMMTDTTVLNAFSSIASANGTGEGPTGIYCDDTGTAYVVESVEQATTTLWCIDSTGFAGAKYTTLGAGVTHC